MLVIDAHNHFWQYDPVKYSWIGDDISILKRNFLPQQLQPALDYYKVGGVVAVQARQDHEDNRFLLKQAKSNPVIKGVVGWVNLTADDVEENLHSFALDPKFVGIRHMVQSEPDEQFLLRKDFNRGIGLLKNFNLAYDILIHDRLLPVATTFVERFPDQKFVLDHIAKPPIKAGKLKPWEMHIRSLAENTQCLCKVSGLVTEADWFKWKESDIIPYLDAVFDAFGPDRLMFGSDWPVCLIAADYERVWDLINNYLAHFGQEDQEKIMGLNAVDFYNLNLSHNSHAILPNS